ncbi:PLDc N-terminal domain-containing protein [Arthrobacter sp. SO5]|uniref:PLDc N-terminal domain-containing protein n=1 Tax=Arthrobacter sp. SO5 TaxID=1897055 RepID=UPI001E5F05B8|nr:PLDc N-terminal domain-containing protein [Arthrobacter sp. SO5]
MTFWDFFWLMVWTYLFIAYLVILFQIIKDIFSDSERTGWSKALWVILLVIVPILGSLAYLIAHGRSMALRQAARSDVAKEDVDDYVRRAAGSSPAEEISRAKTLMDDGTITAGEFAAIKERALRQ